MTKDGSTIAGDASQPGSTTRFWVTIVIIAALVTAALVWLTRDEPTESAQVVDAGQAGVESVPAGHWERVDAPFDGGVATRVVAADDGTVVAAVLREDGVGVWRSEDAVEWRQAAVLRGSGPPTHLSLSAALGLLFVGTDEGFWVSSDGYDWLDVSPAGLGEDTRVHDVVGHQGGFVAVGSLAYEGGWQPAAWTSVDGRTWSASTPATSPGGDLLDEDVDGSLHAVASDGVTLVAVGTPFGQLSDATWTSTDGVTWVAGERPSDTPNGQPGVLHDVLVRDGWLAGGAGADGSGLWTSPSGTAWARAPFAEPASATGRITRLVDLDHGGAALEQLGDQLEERALWTAGDDGRWQRVALPDGIESLPVRDVAAVGGALVGVGHDVWIWTPGGATEPVPVTTTLDPTQPTLATVPPGSPDMLPGRPPMGSLGSPALDLPPFEAADATEQAIIDAVYAAFGGGPYIKGDRTRFEGDISDAFDEAVVQYPQHAEGIAAAVYEVTLLSPTEAEVVFDIIDDDVLVTATTRGRVVLQDGTWVVSQATICEMMSRGGLRCP